MPKNILLAGTVYNNVPAIELPTPTQGTAIFYDVSDTTAQQQDVADGKYFYTSGGQRIVGTNTGGGSDTPVTAKDVNFYDVDGRIFQAYTLAQFMALDAMPSFPVHSWLTGNGWNMTLEEAQGIAAGAGSLAITGSWRTSDGKVDILHSRIVSGNYDLFDHNGKGVDWGTDYYTASGANFGYYVGRAVVDSTIDGGPAMRIWNGTTSTAVLYGKYVRTAELITIPSEATTLHFIVNNSSSNRGMFYCAGLLPQSASNPYKSGSTIQLAAYTENLNSTGINNITDISVDIRDYAGQQYYVIINAFRYAASQGSPESQMYVKSVYFE